MRFLLLLPFLWAAALHAQTWTIVDEDGGPLAGATVLQLPDSAWTVTDAAGRFTAPRPLGPQTRLRVTFVGYRARVLRPDRDPPGRVGLSPERALLAEVLVTETHHHLEEALATAHLEDGALRRADRSSLAAALETEPGVAVIRTGIGIAKPVIRGLYGQRLVVQDQGIKQEGQQWGQDHGLELDPFAAERLEVIKGPGSLLYGSDALGGALRILPPAFPAEGTWRAGVEAVHRGVNRHWGGSAYAGARLGRWAVLGRYSRQDFGDYAVPADSFTFQGFRLPIADGLLKNTAGNEEAWSVTLGRLGTDVVQRWHLSRYRLDVGLFSGAVGIPRAYALTPDGDRRDIDNPSQSVDHLKAAWHLSADAAGWHWTLDAGLQRNLRREFSFPEFHSLPVLDPADNLALELDLWTGSLSGHADRELGGGWSLTLGADGQVQDHRAGGFERLLPGFRLWRAGAYAVAYQQVDDRARWTFGLRADAGHNRTDFQRRYVYDTGGEITDSLLNPATEGTFGNWAGSVGYNRDLGFAAGAEWVWRSHLGKSFRIPHPAETASNGVHHGTFRHEQGNPDLRSEHGFQLDVGLSAEGDRWTLELDGYANAYLGFIYLSPSARLSPLPEAGQIFAYRQDDALFGGGELRLRWRPAGPLQGLEAEWTAEGVWNRNLESGLPLPFTPPVSFRNRWSWTGGSGAGFVPAWEVFAAPRAVLAQNRVDRNEAVTPGYLLLDAGAGLTLAPGGQPIELLFKAFNLLDESYLNHLSRYRLVGIPEPGRNLVVSLRVPLEGRLR